MAVPAFAQSGAASVAAEPREAALRQKVATLRARLATLTTEIQALKKKSRTVAEDYRLRDKLAEADATGRSLTDAEAQLRRLPGAVPPAPQRLQATPSAPVARPGDGPLELDAKADILLDQAERFANEATRMEAQVAQSAHRDALRRRVRRIENDPFIAIEASKRNLVLSQQGPSRDDKSTNNDPESGGLVTGNPTGGGRATTLDGNPAPSGAPANGPFTNPPTPENTAGRDSTAPMPATAPSFSGSDALFGHAVLPPQFRTLLDPQTLAEVRRLEGVGTPASRAAALRAAVAGLRARAASLQQQAKTLRQSR